MIVFPIVEGESRSEKPVSIWQAVQERQKQASSAYWLVTQPAHAALAGDLAAALRDDLFGKMDAIVCRSIALHDAGWSMDDAQQIQQLRASAKLRPQSFLEAPVDQALSAWKGSIDTAEKFAAIGGYLVSRHFERLSLSTGKDSDPKLEAFRKREKQRQRRLQSSLGGDERRLERLVDGLQFCDVLSLYLCCGSMRTVTIENPKITLSRAGEGYKIEPSPFKIFPAAFNFSALRHPSASAGKAKSGATFYVNL